MSEFEPIIAAAKRMEGFDRPWFVSGGWAIDLFLGRVTRAHGDREIGVFRHDQLALQRHLGGHALFKVITRAETAEWTHWDMGECLELPIHQLLMRRAGSEPPSTEEDRTADEIEFFLNESSDGVWRCRRNMTITRAADGIIEISQLGLPILSPEIQLLYKAKHVRAKDEKDFEIALPLLDAPRRAWLKNSLRICYGEHPWIGKL